MVLSTTHFRGYIVRNMFYLSCCAYTLCIYMHVRKCLSTFKTRWLYSYSDDFSQYVCVLLASSTPSSSSTVFHTVYKVSMDLMSRFVLCRRTHVGKYKVLILKHSLFWFHSRREPVKCSGVFLWRAIAQEQGNVMQAFPQMSLRKSVLAYFLSIGCAPLPPPPSKRWYKCEKDFFYYYYKYHLSCIFSQ